MGVWPDAYYVSFNLFNAAGTQGLGTETCAFDRAAMLSGATATQQCSMATSSGETTALPATIDGTLQPPAGEPEWFVALSPDASNSLAYWKFHVDWQNPANSSLTRSPDLAVRAFSQACAGGTCIPQAGTSQKLDSLGDRLMFRLAYRNFGDHEAMVVSHAVKAGTSVAMRWYELRPSGDALSVFQQGTYAPNSTYRWMGSIAMDHSGDMALGYSTASKSLHPGIGYTGRLAGDAAGTMPQGEATILTGAGSQTGQALSRWGDYTEMSVDPADDCTFWYVNQYEPSNGAFNWHTRIGSVKFPGCSTPKLAVSPASVSAGGSVSVSWSGVVSPTSGDWVGLYHPGDPYSALVDWFYANSCTQTAGSSALASGSCSFTMPSTGGPYELRLFTNDTWTVIATSNPVSVTGGATLAVSPASVSAGGSVSVSWSGVVSPTSGDWVGLYHPGDPYSALVDWFYVNSCTQTAGSSALASGSCSFTMPSTGGSYELRLFTNDTWTVIATSNPVTVG